MAIQWFPGHMTSARRKAAETMEFTDVIIEVLDARAPEASCNPMIRELREHRQRPCLKILNKIDLADPATTQEWLDYYNKQEGVKAVALSCKSATDAARVPKLCHPLAPHRDSPHKPLRLMIMGIPNVGKSTLMNMLLKRRVANVGDEPAVTKSQQCHKINDHMTLTDSPGLMWPKIEYEEDGFILAAIHAIGRNAVIEEEIAEHLATNLLARYPERITERFGFSVEGMDGYGVVEAVAKKRGCILKGRGGELDIEKAAMILLTEYRAGKLGRISLESPSSREAMIKYALENPVKPRVHSLRGEPDEQDE
ncbi:MAG: ribosome biogenesis GTPase YlqF [Gallionellales bacterium RIFOXYB12_FULL_54_9]|nr:MAG: ribosome biogenesis GTPase YlqF [Gallionellales bacterium RIFOXYB12_FULL_54_9]